MSDQAKRFARKKRREALAVAGVDVPRNVGADILGTVFEEVGLKPRDYEKTSGLTDPDRTELKNHSAELQAAMQKHVDSCPKAEDDHGWKRVRNLYANQKQAEARVLAAELVIDELQIVTHEKTERVYSFDDEKGVYLDGGKKAICRLLVSRLGKHHSRFEEKEIVNKVQRQTYHSEFGGAFVPVANGDLFLNALELQDVNPDRGPLARSPARWCPDAECPIFREYLKQAVPIEAERETLREYVGYGLMHWRLPHHKALFLIGPTASGKSTLLDTLRRLYGATSSVSLHQLVNGRFGAIELEGTWANIQADVSADILRNIGKFKEIVAGDPIYVERKHEQGYRLDPTAKHFYSANRLPDISNDDDAFFRRILLVSFPKTVPRDERDPDLPDRLRQELDGILKWAVEGLRRVMSNCGFTHDLTPEETRRRWQQQSSSIGRFRASALKVTGNSESDIEAKAAVYSAYTQFCRDQGLSAETQTSLTSTLKRNPRISDAKRTPSSLDRQVRCYTGVKMRDEYRTEQTEPPF